MIFIIILFTLLSYRLYLLYYKKFYKQKKTQKWFNKIVLDDNNKSLHAKSGWGYLTEEKFNEKILFELNKYNIKFKDNDSIIDIGCGSGSIFKIIKNINNKINIYGTDLSINCIKLEKKLIQKFKIIFILMICLPNIKCLMITV